MPILGSHPVTGDLATIDAIFSLPARLSAKTAAWNGKDRNCHLATDAFDTAGEMSKGSS